MNWISVNGRCWRTASVRLRCLWRRCTFSGASLCNAPFDSRSRMAVMDVAWHSCRLRTNQDGISGVEERGRFSFELRHKDFLDSVIGNSYGGMLAGSRRLLERCERDETTDEAVEV